MSCNNYYLYFLVFGYIFAKVFAGHTPLISFKGNYTDLNIWLEDPKAKLILIEDANEKFVQFEDGCSTVSMVCGETTSTATTEYNKKNEPFRVDHTIHWSFGGQEITPNTKNTTTVYYYKLRLCPEDNMKEIKCSIKTKVYFKRILQNFEIQEMNDTFVNTISFRMLYNYRIENLRDIEKEGQKYLIILTAIIVLLILSLLYLHRRDLNGSARLVPSPPAAAAAVNRPLLDRKEESRATGYQVDRFMNQRESD